MADEAAISGLCVRVLFTVNCVFSCGMACTLVVGSLWRHPAKCPGQTVLLVRCCSLAGELLHWGLPETTAMASDGESCPLSVHTCCTVQAVQRVWSFANLGWRFRARVVLWLQTWLQELSFAPSLHALFTEHDQSICRLRWAAGSCFAQPVGGWVD